MGTNQFQREYIEYLQERNNELLKKLTDMKENYEKKIFSKDLSKHYLTTALEDILNVCTVLPKEIDSFFDKITGAMDILKNILIKKSEMVILTEKISHAINLSASSKENLLVMEDPGFLKETNFDAKTEKKAGTAKVSPMINGHVISTAPRIYLCRIPEDLSPERNETHPLSPIVEVSPNISLDASGLGQFSKELRIPLERINSNKLPHNSINMDSPKSPFKGFKTWKESLMVKTQLADSKKNVFLVKPENINEKPESIEQHKTTENEDDPLEGPSWLYNKNAHYNESSLSSKFNTFVDCRPRKNRFASVLDTKAESTEAEKNDAVMLMEVDNTNESECEKTKKEKINETPEDYIRECCVEEGNDLHLEKSINLTSRKYIEESRDENGFSEFEADVRKHISTPYSKTTDKYSPVKSHSFHKADSEEDPSARKSVNKSPWKRSMSMFDEISMKRSSGIGRWPKSYDAPDCVEKEKPRIHGKNKKKKNPRPKSGKRNAKQKIIIKEVYVQLSDYRNKSSKTQTSEEKKKTSAAGKSPEVMHPENEGRKRRRAAPICLVEPALRGKLRRE